MPENPVVISLCDRTGNMVRPWAEAGYQCWCIDLQNTHRRRLEQNIFFFSSNVMFWEPPKYCFPLIWFAFPSCTDLASSGARWWKGKGLTALSKAIALVGRCAELADKTQAPWMIENPIGSLATYWRKPDAQFDPCDYGGYLDPIGDEYTKRTCLWTGNGFNVPIPKPVFPIEGSRMHLVSPSEDRANIRSETPKGFAQAVFLANEPMVRQRLSKLELETAPDA